MAPSPELARPSLVPGVHLSKPADADYWVINDGSAGRYFRLNEQGHELVAAIDGRRTVTDIAARLAGRSGRQVTPAAVLSALRQLAPLGLVAGLPAEPAVDDDRAAQSDERGRLSANRRSVLFIKCKAFDPRPLIERLYPVVRHLLGRPALALYGAAVAAAAIVVATHWPQFGDEAGKLLGRELLLSTMALAYLVNLPFVFGHEFAHAFTARHFGVHVREMGFLLIYFNPALYANVSGAWHGSRRARLSIGFAGIAFNLVMSAIAVLAWLPLQGTAAGRLLILLAAIGAVTCLINLNPLIRLDGYYLLADWLRIPNLRTRSFRLLGNLVRGRGVKRARASARERAIYLSYGIVGGAYSMALIVWSSIWLADRIGGALGDAGRIAGVLVIPGMLLAGRLTRTGGLFPRWSRRPRPASRDLSATVASPASVQSS